MISITINGVGTFEVPSNAADTNWAAKQVAFERGVADGINGIFTGPRTFTGTITFSAIVATTGTVTTLTATNATITNLTAGGPLVLSDYGADLNPMGGTEVNHTRGSFLVPSGENNWTISNSKILDPDNPQMCICQLRSADGSARTVQSVDVSTPGSLTVYFTGNLAADNVVDFVILS